MHNSFPTRRSADRDEGPYSERSGRQAAASHQGHRAEAGGRQVQGRGQALQDGHGLPGLDHAHLEGLRSEEHTSELQSLMRISYAVFCLQKKTSEKTSKTITHN